MRKAPQSNLLGCIALVEERKVIKVRALANSISAQYRGRCWLIAFCANTALPLGHNLSASGSLHPVMCTGAVRAHKTLRCAQPQNL
jgi:hypothetical protein